MVKNVRLATTNDNYKFEYHKFEFKQDMLYCQ